MYLIIDTSTNYGGVALHSTERLLRATCWHSRQNHSVQLMPAIEDVLYRTGSTPEMLHGIGVAKGPGGFNALRTGVGVAKGLAFPLGIPMVGVSTLEAEAYPHRASSMPLCPLLQMGREHLAWGLYRHTANEWHTLVPEQLGTLEELLQMVTEPPLFCSEGATTHGEALETALGTRAVVPNAYTPFTRLGGLAALAICRLERGERDHLASFQPHYLRSPGITPPRPPRPIKRGATATKPISGNGDRD